MANLAILKLFYVSGAGCRGLPLCCPQITLVARLVCSRQLRGKPVLCYNNNGFILQKLRIFFLILQQWLHCYSFFTQAVVLAY